MQHELDTAWALVQSVPGMDPKFILPGKDPKSVVATSSAADLQSTVHDVPEPKSSSKDRLLKVTCFVCSEVGHRAKDCPIRAAKSVDTVRSVRDAKSNCEVPKATFKEEGPSYVRRIIHTFDGNESSEINHIGKPSGVPGRWVCQCRDMEICMVCNP